MTMKSETLKTTESRPVDARGGTGGNKPPRIGGMRHIALTVADVEGCERFYVDLLGYEIEWRPDADNVYLSCGEDNIALHRGVVSAGGCIDHFGIILRKAAHVDVWFEFLRAHKVMIHTEPKTHRDGARSFYCSDPAGNRLQMIYHPPISDSLDG